MAWALFRKNIEWATDDSNDTLVYKYPFKDNGRELNNKSTLTVRESQVAIFVHKGKIADIFSAGIYELDTEILPILSNLAAWKYAFQTPITVDIYFINTKQFTNVKWGTQNPILMRDPEFGVIRVRGFGAFAFRVSDPAVFLKELFGTSSSFKTADIKDWAKTMLVSALADCIGESKISALDLAGNTLEFNEAVKASIQSKFNEIGLELTNLFIENMSVPTEIEKAIDQKSKLNILSDSTDTMMQIAAAEALKDAAKNPGMGGAFMSAGVGAGAGVGLAKMFNDAMNSNATKPEKASAASGHKCAKCSADIPANAKFCPNCGEKVSLEKFCSQCGAKIAANAKFCPECGNKL
ncbi:MAG: SPFH domain-containing protein [Christensenellaceae bacterium]